MTPIEKFDKILYLKQISLYICNYLFNDHLGLRVRPYDNRTGAAVPRSVLGRVTMYFV